MASASKKLVIIADETKKSKVLGDHWKKGIPIDVVPFAHALISHRIQTQLGGICTLRTGSGKAGPVVTDNGHFILDVQFPDYSDPSALDLKLQMMPGIVDTGLFCGLADHVYFGSTKGTVETLESPTR